MSKEEKEKKTKKAKEEQKDTSQTEEKKDMKKETKKEETSRPKVEKRDVDGDSVTKVLVEPDDEVTFVIEQLEEVKTKRVVVSVPEGSDLLVSSVAMKLIAKNADEEDKLVAVATDDPAGQNMARLAGLGVAPSIDAVSDDTWNFAKASKESRMQEEKKEEGGEEKGEEGMTAAVAGGEPGGLVNKDFQDNMEESEDIAQGIEEKPEEEVEPMDLGRPRGSMGGAMVGAAGMMGAAAAGAKVSAEAGAGASAAAGGASAEVPISKERTVKQGSFEMKVDDGNPVRPEGKVTPVPKPDTAGAPGFVGRDFASYAGAGSVPPREVSKPAEVKAEPKPEKKKGKSIAGILAGLPIIKGLAGSSRGKLKKLLIPAFVLVVLGLIGVYWFTSEVVAEIDVESIAVSYEGEITAKTTAEDTDKEELVIPARAETATNNGSDTASATGTALRGEKAGGVVTIYNKTDDDITVAAGTILSNGGLGFVLQSEVVVPKRPDPIGMGSIQGNVIAQEVGTEYNLAAGTTFAVGQTALSELSATNAAAFTGGTKEEYSVVSQEDIDGVADKLKKKLYAESKDELAGKYEDTKWTFIGDSIKNELDGDVSSDVPAGAEQDSVNVDVKTKSTALYYDSESLDELIETLLMEDVGSDSLDGIELSDNMEKNISIKSSSVDDGTIIILVDVSGYVMPQMDKEEIERNLYGKSWAEGVKYLKDLEYVSGDPDVTFYPSWIPEFAWRMPSRKGQISVNVNNVVPEEEGDQQTTEEAPAEGETAAEE